jgi:hypothetical protein
MALDHVTYFRVLISEILQGTTTEVFTNVEEKVGMVREVIAW